MDIIYLQMVNASRKNLKAHSPFVRLASPRSIWACFMHTRLDDLRLKLVNAGRNSVEWSDKLLES
jgi:hypothetical protein